LLLFATYYEDDEIKEHQVAGHVACMGGVRNVYRILIGKRDNINMDLKNMGWEDVDWVYVAQDRDQSQGLVNTIINL
jgi:hypothetical protein